MPEQLNVSTLALSQIRSAIAERASWMDFWTPLGGDTFPPAVFTAATAGGTVDKSENGVNLATDGTANESARLVLALSDAHMDDGAVIAGVWIRINQAIGSLAHEMTFGFNGGSNRVANDIAVYSPNVGDSTAGNIRVDNGGADTDGTLDYPTVNSETHFYGIVLDLDDSETRFFVDRDPILGTPNATISAIPAIVPRFGARIEDTSGAGSDSTEQLRVVAIGYGYRPEGV